MTGTMLDAALEYAARGWPVFPVYEATGVGACACGGSDGCSPGKHPRTKHGALDATTDRTKIGAWWKQWPSAAVGIRTGTEGGIWAVDCDLKPGRDGIAALDAIREQHPLPPTMTVRTGSGGLQLWFQVAPGQVVKNSQNKIAPGIDTRGERGYVVAPPSPHASGGRYHVEVDRAPATLTEHPILEALARSTASASASPPRPAAATAPLPPGETPMRERALAYIRAECSKLAAVATERWPAVLRSSQIVAGVLHYGVGAEEARALIVEACVANGAAEKYESRLHRAIDDGFKHGEQRPLTLEDRPRAPTRAPAWESPPDDGRWEGPSYEPPAPRLSAPPPPAPSPGPSASAPPPPVPAAAPAPKPQEQDNRDPAAISKIEQLLTTCRISDREGVALALGELTELAKDLAAVWTTHESRIRGALATIRGLKGCATGADRVLKLIEKEAERLGEEAAARQTRRTSTAGVGAWADELALPTSNVPGGYDIDDRAVYHLRITSDGDERRDPIATAPILVTALLQDVRTDDQLVEVAWKERARKTWSRRVVSRGEIADGKALVARLAGFGAPVTSSNARDVVSWLATWVAENPLLPRRTVSESTGWCGDAFLLGHTVIAPVGVDPIEIADTGKGLGPLLDALSARGTWEGWLEGWSVASRYPRVALAVAASVLPALLDICPEIPSFVVSWSGSTSTGKTSTLKLAASVWGSPDERDEEGGLLGNWDATLVGLERRAAMRRGIPTLLDETQRAKRKKGGESEVGEAIYMLVSGRGRDRGAVRGVASTATWRTIVLSTGESPISAFATAGGVATRVLELWGSPWGGEAGDAVRAMERAIHDHHGHLALRVVELLVHRKDRAEWVRDRYRALCDFWMQRGFGDGTAGPGGGAGAGGRLAKYVAALQLAFDVAGEAGLPVPDDVYQPALEVAWKAVGHAVEGADRARLALGHVHAVAVANENRWYGRHACDRIGTPISPSNGWLGAWTLEENETAPIWLPQTLDQALASGGFPPAQIMRIWEERGWLERGSDRIQVSFRINGKVAKGYRMSRTAWKLASGE